MLRSHVFIILNFWKNSKLFSILFLFVVGKKLIRKKAVPMNYIFNGKSLGKKRMAKVAKMSGRKFPSTRLCDHFANIPRPTKTPLNLFSTNAGLLVDKVESWVAPIKL